MLLCTIRYASGCVHNMTIVSLLLCTYSDAHQTVQESTCSQGQILLCLHISTFGFSLYLQSQHYIGYFSLKNIILVILPVFMFNCSLSGRRCVLFYLVNYLSSYGAMVLIPLIYWSQINQSIYLFQNYCIFVNQARYFSKKRNKMDQFFIQKITYTNNTQRIYKAKHNNIETS